MSNQDSDASATGQAGPATIPAWVLVSALGLPAGTPRYRAWRAWHRRGNGS